MLFRSGSVKDRVALRSRSSYTGWRITLIWVAVVIDDAERQGLLHPHTGSRIFEGTVGSTGISIATVAKARYVIAAVFRYQPLSYMGVYRGYEASACIYADASSRTSEAQPRVIAIIMPDDVAQEKVQALLVLGAEVERVRPASIVDKDRKSTRLNSSHSGESRMPSSA